jgi:glycopeptide antibiotics resistance protein
MLTLSRRSARLSLVAYLGFVLLVTQIPTGRAPMEPNLVPLAGILSTFRDGGAAFGIGQLIGNLILLAPLGVLLPLAHPRVRPVPVVAVALALSCAIELAQWLMANGRMADIDDVWLNTLGAAAGMGLGGLLGHPKADR